MKYLVGIISCLLLAGSVWAQNIDEARMSRDLEIAEDILNSLLHQNQEDNMVWKGTDVRSNYVPDYGVILTIPSNKRGWPISFRIGDKESRIVLRDGMKIEGDAEEIITGVTEKYEAHLTSVMETFLVDYADLIGQLKPSDKIMVKSEQKQTSMFVIGGGDHRYNFNYRSGSGQNDDDDDNEENEDCCEDLNKDYILSAEVKKSDLVDYKSGKINREQLVDRLVMEKTEVSERKEPELELLSSIFYRLYKSDLSETYFATRAPQYDRVVNFGVIYEWRVYSSNIDNDKHNMPTIDAYNLTPEERNRKVEELYPKFKEQFKRHMLEYGRTLKGLKPDELLMFKVRLTECKGCTIPKSIELSVKRSVLDDFEKQKITLVAAASKVTLREHMTE